MCCRSCFKLKLDYDVTIEPSQNSRSRSEQQLESNEITYETEGIRLTNHTSMYRKKNAEEGDTVNAAYVHEGDNQIVASSKGNTGDYDFGVVPHISVNGQVDARDNDGDVFKDATLHTVVDIPKPENEPQASEAANANGVIVNQPRSDGTPPGSQHFVIPGNSAEEKEEKILSSDKPLEAEVNLLNNKSSEVTKGADPGGIKAGAKDDVELSSEPVKFNDEGLVDEAGQSDVADKLTVGDLQKDLTYENIDLSLQVSVQDSPIQVDVIVHGAESKEDNGTAGDVCPQDKYEAKPVSANEPLPSNEPVSTTSGRSDIAPPAKQTSKASSTPGEEEEMTDDDIAMSWAINYYSGRV